MFRSQQAVKVVVKLRSKSSKKVVLSPRFLGAGDTLNFGRHAFSNRIYFRTCDRFWLSSVQRARSVADE